MSYRRFTLSPPTVANVASVASPEPETSIRATAETVASVASVARVQPDSAVSATLAVLVSVEDVMMMFERATARLMGLGKGRADAERNATAIVRAELHNDPRLSEIQVTVQCFICGGGDRQGDCLVPVLSAHAGRHHWLHSRECHAEHRRRQAEKADACLRAAGIVSAMAVAA